MFITRALTSRTDPQMGQLYERIAFRRDEGKAFIRMANKVATIIWHMLTKGQPYHKVKEKLYRSKFIENDTYISIAMATIQRNGKRV